MSKITYPDKLNGATDGRELFTVADANSIKESVNALYENGSAEINHTPASDTGALPTAKGLLSVYMNRFKYYVDQALGTKANTSHHHDSAYAATAHNHDTAYAALSHNHNSAYASISHNHDASYAPLLHNHAAGDIAGLATVATSGAYADLSGKPQNIITRAANSPIAVSSQWYGTQAAYDLLTTTQKNDATIDYNIVSA